MDLRYGTRDSWPDLPPTTRREEDLIRNQEERERQAAIRGSQDLLAALFRLA